MALRSATECAAIFDVCSKLKTAENETLDSGRDLLLRLVEPEPGTGTGTTTT